MELSQLKAIIEALLFVAQDSLSIEKIAEIVDIDAYYVEEAIEEMTEEYRDGNRGIFLEKREEGLKLVTKPELAFYIQRLLYPRAKQGLSQAALETLSVIALKQPVTRLLIEEIRGVSSDGPISSLLEKGLIEEQGRLNVPGKPRLFGTTPLFLEYFHLKDMEDLKAKIEEGQERLAKGEKIDENDY